MNGWESWKNNIYDVTIYHDDSADAHDLSGGGVRLTV